MKTRVEYWNRYVNAWGIPDEHKIYIYKRVHLWTLIKLAKICMYDEVHFTEVEDED